MIASQAKRISSFYISHGVIREQDREKYNYCYEILLSTGMNVLAIALIGLATSFLLPSACFVLSFILLKNTVGGYHADSHKGCFAATVGTYLGFRLLAAFLPAAVLTPLAGLLAVFAAVTVFRLAPLGTGNKPLGRKQAARLKRDGRLLILLFSLTVLILLLCRTDPRWAFSVSFGIAAVAASLIAGKRKLAKTQ